MNGFDVDQNFTVIFFAQLSVIESKALLQCGRGSALESRRLDLPRHRYSVTLRGNVELNKTEKYDFDVDQDRIA